MSLSREQQAIIAKELRTNSIFRDKVFADIRKHPQIAVDLGLASELPDFASPAQPKINPAIVDTFRLRPDEAAILRSDREMEAAVAESTGTTQPRILPQPQQESRLSLLGGSAGRVFGNIDRAAGSVISGRTIPEQVPPDEAAYESLIQAFPDAAKAVQRPVDAKFTAGQQALLVIKGALQGSFSDPFSRVQPSADVQKSAGGQAGLAIGGMVPDIALVTVAPELKLVKTATSAFKNSKLLSDLYRLALTKTASGAGKGAIVGTIREVGTQVKQGEEFDPAAVATRAGQTAKAFGILEGAGALGEGFSGLRKLSSEMFTMAGYSVAEGSKLDDPATAAFVSLPLLMRFPGFAAAYLGRSSNRTAKPTLKEVTHDIQASIEADPKARAAYEKVVAELSAVGSDPIAKANARLQSIAERGSAELAAEGQTAALTPEAQVSARDIARRVKTFMEGDAAAELKTNPAARKYAKQLNAFLKGEREAPPTDALAANVPPRIKNKIDRELNSIYGRETFTEPKQTMKQKRLAEQAAEDAATESAFLKLRNQASKELLDKGKPADAAEIPVEQKPVSEPPRPAPTAKPVPVIEKGPQPTPSGKPVEPKKARPTADITKDLQSALDDGAKINRKVYQVQFDKVLERVSKFQQELRKSAKELPDEVSDSDVSFVDTVGRFVSNATESKSESTLAFNTSQFLRQAGWSEAKITAAIDRAFPKAKAAKEQPAVELRDVTKDDVLKYIEEKGESYPDNIIDDLGASAQRVNSALAQLDMIDGKVERKPTGKYGIKGKEGEPPAATPEPVRPIDEPTGPKPAEKGKPTPEEEAARIAKEARESGEDAIDSVQMTKDEFAGDRPVQEIDGLWVRTEPTNADNPTQKYTVYDPAGKHPMHLGTNTAEALSKAGIKLPTAEPEPVPKPASAAGSFDNPVEALAASAKIEGSVVGYAKVDGKDTFTVVENADSMGKWKRVGKTAFFDLKAAEALRRESKKANPEGEYMIRVVQKNPDKPPVFLVLERAKAESAKLDAAPVAETPFEKAEAPEEILMIPVEKLVTVEGWQERTGEKGEATFKRMEENFNPREWRTLQGMIEGGEVPVFTHTRLAFIKKMYAEGKLEQVIPGAKDGKVPVRILDVKAEGEFRGMPTETREQRMQIGELWAQVISNRQGQRPLRHESWNSFLKHKDKLSDNEIEQRFPDSADAMKAARHLPAECAFLLAAPLPKGSRPPYLDRYIQLVGELSQDYPGKINRARANEVFNFIYGDGSKEALNLVKVEDIRKQITERIADLTWDVNKPFNFKNSELVTGEKAHAENLPVIRERLSKINELLSLAKTKEERDALLSEKESLLERIRNAMKDQGGFKFDEGGFVRVPSREDLVNLGRRLANKVKAPAELAGDIRDGLSSAFAVMGRHESGRAIIQKVVSKETDERAWAGMDRDVIMKAYDQVSGKSKKWMEGVTRDLGNPMVYHNNFKRLVENMNITDIRNAASSDILKMVSAFNRITQAEAARFVSVGGKVYDKRGNLVDFRVIPNYFPHILTKAARRALQQQKGDLYNALSAWADGEGMTEQLAHLSRNPEFLVRHYGSLEYQRTLNLPDYLMVNGERVAVLETNFHKIINRMVVDGNRRTAVVKHFGQGENEYGELYAALARDDFRAAENFKNYIVPIIQGKVPGVHNPDSRVAGLVNVVSDAARTGQLSMSFVAQIGGFLFVPAKYGARSSIRATISILRDLKKGNVELEELKMMGDFHREFFDSYAATEGMTEGGKKAGKVILAPMVVLNEMINDVSALTAKYAVQGAIKAIKSGDTSMLKRIWGTDKESHIKALKNDFLFTDADIQRMIDSGLSKQDIARIAQRAPALTNAMSESALDRPPWLHMRWAQQILAYTSFGRALGKMGAYGLKETKRGNLKPLAYYLAGGVASYEIVALLKGVVFDRARDDETYMERLWVDVVRGGMLGLMGVPFEALMFSNSFKEGIEDLFVPPQFDTVLDLLQGFATAAGEVYPAEKIEKLMRRSFPMVKFFSLYGKRVWEGDVKASAERLINDNMLYLRKGKTADGVPYNMFDAKPEYKSTVTMLLKRTNFNAIVDAYIAKRERDMEKKRRDMKNAGMNPSGDIDSLLNEIENRP